MRALSLALLAAAGLALSRFGVAWSGSGEAASTSPSFDQIPLLPALIFLPALLWAPGVGWARWLARRPQSALAQGLDAAWLGMATAWIDVAVVRELGLRGAAAGWGLWALAALWALAGHGLGHRAAASRPLSAREGLGGAAVALALIGVIFWRAVDLNRPLDGSWYLAGADEEGHATIDLSPGDGWTAIRHPGWEEAGAWVARPDLPQPTLRSQAGAHGRMILAVRGPVGSFIALNGQRAEVAAAMAEDPEEGPVQRYLRRGVAAVGAEVDLPPGGELPIAVQGEAVYGMPSTEAVWALHATGELRYVHYYQLLNQVENQVWAEELLSTRRLTLNQPPGWSPLLAVATLLVAPDLTGANALFLWVVLLVGLSGLRLIAAVAPGAPAPAWLLPAAMAAVHAHLMIEPGSCNFPDSLFAASILGVAVALAEDRPGAFAGMGLAASLLRYPGPVVSVLLAGAWALCFREVPWPALRRFGGAMAALAGLALLAGALGELQDAAFIVWFETFPEHWHGDYQAGSLLPRIPEFYGLWLRYTGGALALALAGAALARPGGATQAARALLAAALAYSCVLATVDHHPTHYFLPLVGLTGPALAAAAAGSEPRWLRIALPSLGLLGVAATLLRGGT